MIEEVLCLEGEGQLPNSDCKNQSFECLLLQLQFRPSNPISKNCFLASQTENQAFIVTVPTD